ncbi:helix-turn-helix transcriptional regulator [Tepidibacter mesophilus]|uniref:helix-turn-helix transcriptional regulator n=1 Tax=Tepidibacter mesophilus TaxID=655607 RepID=UPI000C06AE4B|nr:helix-turn-helix transcriptional regulator [Tepidibacter mesophilus]
MHNNIRQIRNKANLSQQKLADSVGISRPYLSDIERGKKKPSVEIAAKICNTLKSKFEKVFPNNSKL